MGKLIVISGANGSGKSAYAEKLVSRMSTERIYLATMIPVNEENHTRIVKHRQQREGYGFRTIEAPYTVGDVPVAAGAVVLLEDVSNLFANGWFAKRHDAQHVAKDICALQARCKALAAVTIAGLDASGYSGETAAYISGLNHLNALLRERADLVIHMENRSAHVQKGERTFAFKCISDRDCDL